MSSEPILMTVDRPDGVTIRRKVGPVSDVDLAIARPYFDALLALVDGDVVLLAVLVIEWAHEQDVYERVCERKGLLPL